MLSRRVSAAVPTVAALADFLGQPLQPVDPSDAIDLDREKRDGHVTAEALDESPAIHGITLDSRAVTPGDVYAALPGSAHHGAEFAAAAVAAGAVVVVTDEEGARRIGDADALGAPVLVQPDVRSYLGALSAWVYGRPSDTLAVFAVTGTNGKTTTAYLVEAALRAAGSLTGLVGTVETRIGDEALPSAHTTPEAPDLQRLLARMRDAACTDVAMEVSSHALALGRVDATHMRVAGFTNLGHDHLDFHVDQDSYFAAKASLFVPERVAHAVVDVDGAWGRRLADVVRDRGVDLTTVGLDEPAQWSAQVLRADSASTTIRAIGPGVDLTLTLGLPGRFNVSNALLALAMLHAGGVDVSAAAAAWPGVSVPGRMETVSVPSGSTGTGVTGITGVVDFAHTPEAVQTALAALRPHVAGRLIAVLGAGGDRDRDKRPDMGAAAAALADVVIVTDDNPRSEDPAAIRADVLRGAVTGDVREVPDRGDAIRAAVAAAQPGDLVVVLGKGHEQGQHVGGVTLAFDDRRVLRAALEQSPPSGPQRRVLPDADAAALRGALRDLAIARDDTGGSATARTWAVVSGVAGATIEDLDALGRHVVRLDITDLLVVGEPQRALHLGATLEGSWGGESTWVADDVAAGELLRDQLAGDELVLLVGPAAVQLASGLAPGPAW